MASNLHNTDYNLRFKIAYNNGAGWTTLVRSNLLTTPVSNSGVQGEPHYTTDTKQLFIHDGTVVQPVLSLDMVLTLRDNGAILTNRNNGAILTRY